MVISSRLHLANFISIESKWLLTQDVLAGFECGDHPFEVLSVCEADVDGVDIWVADQCPVRLVDDSRLEFRRTFGITARDRVELGTVGCMHGRGHGVCGHETSADEAPANGHKIAMLGTTGRALHSADCSAASMIATTLRDCRACTDIGVLFTRKSTIER